MAKSSNILSGIEESVRFGFPKDQFPIKDKAPTTKGKPVDPKDLEVTVQGIGRMRKAQAEKYYPEPEFKHISNKEGVTEDTDIKRKMLRYEELALAANRAGDDEKCKMYQEKIQQLKDKQIKKIRGVAEGLSWSALDEGLSMEDKLSIFEEFHTKIGRAHV